MRKLFTLFTLIACFMLAKADPVDYVHPKTDLLSGECVVTSDGVTYHSMDYPKTPPTYYGGYVKFTAEQEGDPLTINFSEFNCLRNGNPVVFVYDGDEALSSFQKYSSDVPAGYLAAIRPENINTEYVAQSGVICVLYAPASKSDFVSSTPSGSMSGTYTASVTAGTPKDMEYEAATLVNTGIALHRGMTGATLATLTIKMNGSLNPISLDNLAFDLSAVANCGLVENIRLYDGTTIDEAALLGTLTDGATVIDVPARELKGKNVFTVVADVKADAAGEVPAVGVSILKIAGEDRAVDAGSLSTLAIANEIWMPNSETLMVYTIDGETNFYDCGGPNGIIPAKAKGMLTFVPATEGHKVQVDINKLSLFNTSSTGLNDQFKFYNGREATDDALVAELLKETKVIKSTADDGSLTVSFEVKQGNDGKDGWEAVVSQFMPAPMTFSAMEVSAFEPIATPFAGETDVPVMLFNIKTEQQLNPLTVNSISLSAIDGANVGACEKAKIYYLGETSTFSTKACYAEGALSDGIFVGEQLLAEGDNWFAVALDIAENMPTGAIAGVKLNGVTIGADAVTPTGGAQASVTVDNTCRIAEGTHRHTIYDDWVFLSPAPTSSYSSNYPASTTDHVVTFIPTKQGAVAQLAFDSFDVYYASTSYGSKATFEVYSGESTDAANLIWKLGDNAHSKTGPDGKLRSTASNGSITIKFNPNSSSSTYCGKGWVATVSQFVDHDAEVKSVAVEQASTAIVGPGAANAELLKVDIVTDGTINPLMLSAMNIDVRGRDVIKLVKVLSSATGSLADAEEWGSAELPAEGTAITVSRNADVNAVALAEEHNHFFISVDIADEFASDVAVDARLVSLTFEGGKTLAVENGDPEGVRLTKNIYVLEEGAGHVVTVKNPIIIYDEGGPDGPITKGFNGTVTFVPANADEVLSVNAESFSISSGKMYLYSGREVNKDNLLKNADRSLDYYNTTNGPKELLSKAEDGSITIDYKGTTYIYGTAPEGFAISVTPIKSQPMSVEAIEVDDASEDDVVRGSVDVPVAHVTINAAGTSGTLTISGISADFSASTNLADIKSAQVYYTGSSTNVAPTAIITDKVTDFTDGKVSFEFATPIEINETGAYHLWIGADLSSTATPDNMATATLTGLTANGEAAALPEECSGSRIMVSGMSGTYRVGPSENARYHSIGAAVRALQLGVEGAVLFQIEDGEYKENLSITDVKGTSQDSPVVFTSLSADRDKVVISGASVLDKQGMVYVENSSYIHFRNLTFAPNSGSYYAAVNFKDGSRGCSVDNCVVRAEEINTVTSNGISLVRTEGVNEENRNCDNFTIKNCMLEGGYIALYLGGTSYTALPKDKGLSVIGNTISKSYTKAIYVSDCEDFTIADNVVTAIEGAKKSYNGMDIYRPKGEFRVTGNKLVLSQTLDCTGIYCRQGGGDADAAHPAVVANNVVALPNAANGYTYGVMMDASMTNILFAHNSVDVKASASVNGVYALAFSGNAPAEGAIQVRNNVLHCTGGYAGTEGARKSVSSPLRPWNDTHYANIKFSGNVYYGNNGAVDCDDKTLADYQAATGDDTSVWQQMQFYSDSDLHLREGGDNIMVARLAEVPTDADGAERPDPATAGAYEYAPVVVERPDIMEGYPTVASVKDVSAVVNTRWTVGGSLYAMAVKADAEVPSAEALKATRPVSIEADADVAYTFNFLDQLTAYKAYFLVESALGEVSEIVVSPEFTTLETIEPLVVEIMWDEEAVPAGESILLQAGVIGGKEPYAYEWLDQMGNVVSGDDLLMETASVNQTYRLRVTSSDGQSASAKAHVPVVTETLVVASFEDLPLEAESNWKYDPEADDDTFIDAFFSGSFRFGNFPWKQYGSWSGYGYANETSTDFVTYDDQFRNAVGGGADNTTNYGVAYMMGADMTITVSAPSAGFVVPGIYVTNAAVTLDKIVNGDDLCKKFTAENGDYMTLQIIGIDASGSETGLVEIPLADYRDNTPELLTEWKWVDLSALGAVDRLKFGYESSQQATVPAYVCFDQLGAANPNSGIDATGVDGVSVSIPADDCLSVLGIDGGYTLRVYTVDGVLRATHRLNGASTVSTAGIPAGACMAEIVADSGFRTVLRFLKK